MSIENIHNLINRVKHPFADQATLDLLNSLRMPKVINCDCYFEGEIKNFNKSHEESCQSVDKSHKIDPVRDYVKIRAVNGTLYHQIDIQYSGQTVSLIRKDYINDSQLDRKSKPSYSVTISRPDSTDVVEVNPKLTNCVIKDFLRQLRNHTAQTQKQRDILEEFAGNKRFLFR